MFPYVENYIQNKSLEQESHFRDPRSSEISKQSRICSGKYFDLYFSHSTNSFLEVRKEVERFIHGANSAESIADVITVITEILVMLTKENHKEWVEQLQCHISDIKPSKAYYVASAIYATLYDINDSKEFFALSPQARAEYIISELLAICTDEEFEEFQEITKTDYRRLKVIESISYWLNKRDTLNPEITKKHAELLAQQCRAMCERILAAGIDIYSKEYYQKGNAWVLYRHCKEKEETPKFTAYIMGILAATNVYKLLWDISSEAISDNYTYSITEENMVLFCDNKELLDNLIQNTPPCTEDEEFVNKIYDSYRNGLADVWGHRGVVTSHTKSLSL